MIDCFEDHFGSVKTALKVCGDYFRYGENTFKYPPKKTRPRRLSRKLPSEPIVSNPFEAAKRAATLQRNKLAAFAASANHENSQTTIHERPQKQITDITQHLKVPKSEKRTITRSRSQLHPLRSSQSKNKTGETVSIKRYFDLAIKKKENEMTSGQRNTNNTEMSNGPKFSPSEFETNPSLTVSFVTGLNSDSGDETSSTHNKENTPLDPQPYTEDSWLRTGVYLILIYIYKINRSNSTDSIESNSRGSLKLLVRTESIGSAHDSNGSNTLTQTSQMSGYLTPCDQLVKLPSEAELKETLLESRHEPLKKRFFPERVPPKHEVTVTIPAGAILFANFF
ncbi:hypothetical protein RFI_19098 [Reticulomyxa filosa]|uniref:Uncharacterized protein n=1 Tax=Reticulomyxa filosa TaxID=46433 RepID=X6MWG3_RETFI|nr:hypothetical protein RFI_19098 [Reticulomyxa filosa]|eukprot:ETO18184.1 hypothetical protein RFI_19098 [Reticulomyxa filosa]